jgi:uncharacterized protein YggE
MQRNYLAALIAGLAVLAVVGAGAMAAFGTVGADSTQAQSDERAISVTANGEADAAPDQGVVRIAVTAEGDDPSVVRDELASGADDLRSALEELGVEYETTEYSIQEPHRERGEQAAYQGYHAFGVTVDDPERVGDVVDAAADAGAKIGDVQLTLSDEKRAELRDKAIEAAMGDARHQAETIAASSNLDISGVHNVDASQQHFRAVSYEMAATEDGAGRSTQIDMGSVSVTYNVQVTFNATG